jgi:DNA-binding SARP family transcriptional activator
LEAKVLGPLEARVGGRSVAPSAGKPRQILALLALEAGQVVTVTSLIEELWGTRPPRSAQATLQTYILHLRRLINTGLAGVGRAGAGRAGAGRAVAAKDLLATRPGGYLLDIGGDIGGGGIDVLTYERLAAAGARALDAGDAEDGARLLGSALAVWRGQALVDVPVGLRLSLEVIRLEESRLGVLELRIDADLRLGRHYSLLAELAKLNASYPMHENLCAQFILALYRAGQQWRALDVYTRLRRTLVDELAVEPSSPLQRLHQAILRSEPALHQARTPATVKG